MYFKMDIGYFNLKNITVTGFLILFIFNVLQRSSYIHIHYIHHTHRIHILIIHIHIIIIILIYILINISISNRIILLIFFIIQI